MQIAERWFERKTFPDNITLLWEPHVHPLLRCNIWHVRGRDRDLLVDTGVGVSSLAGEMIDLIDKPLIAVATHIHYDHVGSLHEFSERVMHSAEAPRMADYLEFATLRTGDFPPGFLAGFSDEPGYEDYLIDAKPTEDFSIDAYRIQSTKPTRTVGEGDVIDLGNRHFEVFHLPGHSPGSMGLFEERSETLFSGDAVYDGVLLDNLPDSSTKDYVATMRRLRRLPVSVVHGGHEASFGRDRLHELVDAYIAENERG